MHYVDLSVLPCPVITPVALCVPVTLTLTCHIASGKVPIDKTKAGALCMDQYTKVFGMTRLPGEKCDSLRQAPDSRHIVVLRGDQMFSIDVIDAAGKPVDEVVIQQQLEEIVRVTDEAAPQLPIAILTAEERTTWFKARENLRFTELNCANLDVIETAAFHLCLDDASPTNRNEVSLLLI